MKYQHKKNGKIVTLVETREKYKTVLLEFEDGSTQDVTIPTFKRWWKKLEEVEQEPVIEEKPAPVEEVVPVVKEKETVKKVGRKHREISGTVIELLKCVDSAMDYLGGIVRIPRDENMKFRALCNADGRQVCKLMWSANKIRLYFRADIVCEAYKDFVKVNYSLPYLYEINEYTDKTTEKIKDLLILAVNNDHRKTKKED